MDDRIRNSPFWFTTLRGTPVLGMEDVVVPVAGLDDEIHEDDIVRVDPLTVAWMAGLFPQPSVGIGSSAAATPAVPTTAAPNSAGPGSILPGSATMPGSPPLPGAASWPSPTARWDDPQSAVPGASVWDQPSAPLSPVLPASGTAASGMRYPESTLWGGLPAVPGIAGTRGNGANRIDATTAAATGISAPLPGMPSWLDGIYAGGCTAGVFASGNCNSMA
jgi:hypothetical protein